MAALRTLVEGALAETVTDDLRVRSAPSTDFESVIHSPLLPRGAQLAVLGGPVEASGYTWYRVAPLDTTLDDGVTEGWVAMADRDGTPWISLAKDPTPGFELVANTAGAPDVTADDAAAGARSVNAFGLALYRNLLDDPAVAGEGVVVSPYSIATALAMARAGARGDTATEMDRVLRTDGWEQLAAGLAALDAQVRSHDGAWLALDETGERAHYLALRTANMAFAQDGYPIADEYVDRLGRTFGAGLGLVDYAGAPDVARDAINAWVARQTAGRITDLVDEQAVTTDTRFVIANAVYLKGEWAVPFSVGDTRDRPFDAPGGTVRVPTMKTDGGQALVLAQGDGWRATQLPYVGPSADTPLAMTIVVPDDLGAFEANLTPSAIRRIDAAIAREGADLALLDDVNDETCGTYAYSLRLFLPKFGIDTRADLGSSLAAMGMSTALDATRADLTGITDADRLSIDAVAHQANIDVDERGTEAAAATAVGGDTGGPMCVGPIARETRVFRVDRPFMFLIRDVGTGAILFIGRVTDPARR